MRLSPILLVFVAAGGLTLAAASPAGAAGLPLCNAKHKRPANPYGSVLSEGLKPALITTKPTLDQPAPSGVGAAGNAPSAPARPQEVSRVERRASLTPCGRRRA